MSFSDAETAISAAFSTMATAQTLTVMRDNAPEPASITAKWCRIRFSSDPATLLSMGGTGGNKYRTPGQFVAEVYVPAKQGAETLRDIADAMRDAFIGQRIASPDIQFISVAAGPHQEVGAWSRRDFTVRFRFDEVW